MKENEKKAKYLSLARELKKLWNMKMTVISIIIRALGTVTKGLIKGLEDFEIRERVKTIQTTALLRSARIPRRVLETWGDLLSLKLQWETIGKSYCEKLEKEWIIMIIISAHICGLEYSHRGKKKKKSFGLYWTTAVILLRWL